MNTLLKNSRIITRVFSTKSLLKTTSLIPTNKPIYFHLNTFNHTPKFFFADKPPKGFENFQRKKIKSGNKEKTELHEKKTDEKPSQEKKQDNDNKEEKEEKNNKSESDNEDNKNNNKKKGDNKDDFDKDTLINSGLAIFIIGYMLFYSFKRGNQEITMIEFFNLVSTKKVLNIEIAKDNESSSFFKVICHLNDGSINYLTIVNNDQFLQSLEMKQLEMGISPNEFIPLKYITHFEQNDSSKSHMFFILLLLSILAYRILKKPPTNFKNYGDFKGKSDKTSSSKSSGSSFGSNFNIFDIGKSNVKEVGVEIKVKTKFKHVAGMEQAKKEIMEFVDFLKSPEKYHKLGAKIPRGALLVGPPGTGKTLLAKAVAGEASVPFFAMSGSDFVEMFVGVGASRVRDLFKKAKEKAPSIVFIDEIDAIGRKRGGKFSGGHDERESTLNQLLVEMDGFSTDSNVIILAATNRKDILDPALLRPGRFDRTVEINLPDRKEREEILKIYLKKVKLDTTKSVDEYASRISTLTPGFSGADISNLVNEAAIISARDNLESVNSNAFERASERIIAGLETKRVLTERERKTVAYHEAGHAVVGWFLEYSNPLVKVTIIPRSKGALGFTQYIPDDISLHTKEQLYDLMCVALGGRMAEEKFFGTITTGASDDLQRVTQIANSIVTKFGMSKLGLSSYSYNEEGFVKPYSSHTEAQIEMEVNSIINECAQKTRSYIVQYSEKIEKLALELLKKETLDLMDIIDCLGDRPFPLPDSIKDYLDEIKKRKENKQKEETIETVLDEKDEEKEREREEGKDKEEENNIEGKNEEKENGKTKKKKISEDD